MKSDARLAVVVIKYLLGTARRSADGY